MEFLVLGPIEVRSADSQIRVGGVKQRSILALLIANRGHAVSADRIVEDVYGEDAASGARRSVQSIVSLLRRDLGDVIVGTGDGYVFDAPRVAVDVCRFEDGVAAGLDIVGDDPERAAALLSSALGLWRGDPYGDVDGRVVFEPEIARLSELRSVALESRVEADLTCGRHRAVLSELEALVVEYPLRERLWGLWMLALYRAGRQADALGAYQRLRTVLGEQLGIEPSTEVRELEEQILLQDPTLELVPVAPHNLPASLTSFVGRRLELIEIGTSLAESRLVTLSGAGGSGKTRLAVELARGVLDDYPDGVWFVDLRGVNDPTGVASLIVSTLGVVTAGEREVVDQLVDALWSRRLLLVLDNCEHVLDGVAPLVESLMRRDGEVRMLATSREPLGVPGESVMLVRPLPLPLLAGLEELVESEAAVLLADRAGSAQPGFTVEEHVDSVFEICRAVEGLPLGLELAAARLVLFSPEELADRLDDQLGMLKAPQRAGDLRHATIEATIRWSWDLLDGRERALLSRLSVFHGTWSLGAAEAVCGFDPIGKDQVVDLVASLATKSLVVVAGVSGGSTRYRLLEPIRQFAARELDGPSTDGLRNRFIDYWSAAMAASYNLDAPVAIGDHERAKALEIDQANITAAVEWALASGRFDDAMVIFASPFGDLLKFQGAGLGLATRWMETALEHREAISPGPLVWALYAAVNILATAGRYEAWLGYATLGIEMSRSIEERHWFELIAAVATNFLEGHTAVTDAMFDRVIDQTDDPGMRASALLSKAKLGPPLQTWALVEQAMELSPIDSFGFYDEVMACIWILDSAGDSGHYDIATQMAERALDLSRDSGWLMIETQAAGALAWLYAARGRLEEAAVLIAEAVPVARRILGPTASRSLVPWRAAGIARQRGELDMARDYAEEALRAAEQTEMGAWGTASMLWVTRELALIARDDGELDQAQEILEGALRRLEDLDHVSLVPWISASLRSTRASVELRRSNPDRALEDLRDVLAAPSPLFHIDTLTAVDLTAIALAQRGSAEQAARLKGAVDHERETSGLVIRPPDIPVREVAMRHAQSIYDDDWEAVVRQGRTMTLEQAFKYAVGEAKVGQEPGADTNRTDDEAIVPT